MPKKFDGENTKVKEARERKQEKKTNEQMKKQQKEEDELWKDDDKNIQKKLQRKQEKDEKEKIRLEKKLELKKLEAKELESIKKETKQSSVKVTRLEIQAELEKRELAAKSSSSTAKIKTAQAEEPPIFENLNRVIIEGEVASSVDEAIKTLSLKDQTAAAEVDRNPEKRMKAAFTAFESKHLPRLRQENSNMRLSQIKQMLHKEWLKSPENPLNSSLNLK